MMSDAKKAARAKALWEQQCKYDLLHHQMRVRDLKKKPKLCWLEREMLKASEQIVAGDRIGSRSVDLQDVEYIAELDAFNEPIDA